MYILLPVKKINSSFHLNGMYGKEKTYFFVLSGFSISSIDVFSGETAIVKYFFGYEIGFFVAVWN